LTRALIDVAHFGTFPHDPNQLSHAMRSPTSRPTAELFGLRRGKSLFKNTTGGSRRIFNQRGMTLAEVIVGMLILAFVAAGAVALVTTSYQISERTRLSDNARAVLRTYGDQFLTLEPDSFAAAANLVGQNPQQFMDLRNDPTHTAATITESIGEHGGTVVAATITRSVSFVDIATGDNISPGTQNQAGYLLRGTFTASYQFAGKTQSVSFSLMRACVTQ
jgi:prepilin-type N-terminal cleavage/methylation domain-containing protein